MIINARSAEELGVEEGDWVEIATPAHKVKAKAVLRQGIRPDTTLEGLAQLKPAFEMFLDMPSAEGQKTYRQLINQVYPDVDIKPIHHVGISSGVVDGASAILLASKDYAEKHGLKPRARIVAAADAWLAAHGDKNIRDMRFDAMLASGALDPGDEAVRGACEAEAARMDGASALRRFWHVTLPGLAPVVVAVTATPAVAAPAPQIAAPG